MHWVGFGIIKLMVKITQADGYLGFLNFIYEQMLVHEVTVAIKIWISKKNLDFILI